MAPNQTLPGAAWAALAVRLRDASFVIESSFPVQHAYRGRIWDPGEDAL
jgi:hypothetical protein